jgi:hypothetical protein
VYALNATQFLDGLPVVLVASIASLTVAIVGLRVTIRLSRAVSVRESTQDVLPLAIGLFGIASIASLLRGEVVPAVVALAMTILAWDSALGLDGNENVFHSHRQAINTQVPHLIGTGSVLLLAVGCYFGAQKLLIAGRIGTVPATQVQLAVVFLAGGLVVLVSAVRRGSPTS